MVKVTEYTFRQFMQLAFSENGQPSSKRVVGSLLILGVVITTIICASLGYVTFMPEILNTSLITGAALLGLSSVTSIWKKNGESEIEVESEKSKKKSEENED